MHEKSEIFDTHYNDYCRKIGQQDLDALAGTLGLAPGDGIAAIRFLDREYRVSGDGIYDGDGQKPGYGLCVILAKYILLCPDRPVDMPQWVSFKDFKKDAGFTNTNYFASDVEEAIAKHFSGAPGRLEQACARLGGVPHDTGAAYDLSMRFDALPRIGLLLLFNDRDEEFPAQCRVLFQAHAEYYLDPESLAMTGAGLAKRLIHADGEG